LIQTEKILTHKSFLTRSTNRAVTRTIHWGNYRDIFPKRHRVSHYIGSSTGRKSRYKFCNGTSKCRRTRGNASICDL